MVLTPEEIKKRYPVSSEEVLTYARRHHLNLKDKNIKRRIRKRLRQEKIRAELGRDYSIADTAAEWQIIYGRARVGGAFTLVHSTNNNLWLNLMVTIAGHEIEEIERLYLDEDLVNFGANPDPRWSVSFTTPGGATVAANTKVFMAAQLGTTDQAAQGDLITQAPGVWTSDHKQSNRAGAYVILTWDAVLFPDGMPDLHFQVKGKKCYDPRTDTTVWTENAALIIADYLTDSVYGMGISWDDIYVGGDGDEGGLWEAADVCDETITLQGGGTEKRYTINGAFKVSEDPLKVVEMMCGAMAGSVTFVNGKWKFWPAKYRAPVVDLTEEDITGPIHVETKVSRRDSFNAVKGTFVNSVKAYVEDSFPAVTNAFYQAQDNNQRVFTDIQLPFTVYSATAQRIAKIELERSRQGITVEVPTTLKGFKAEPNDTVTLTLARLGWNQKIFEVEESELVIKDDENGNSYVGCELTLRETAAAVFDWNNGSETTQDLASNTNLPNPGIVSAPEDLAAASGTAELDIRSDGTVFSRIKVSWTHMSDYFVSSGGRIEVRYKKSADSTWRDAAPVPADRDSLWILDVLDGAQYDIQARAVSAAGVESEYTDTLQHVVVGKEEAPSDVTNIAAAVTPYGIRVTWDKVPDKDVKNYKIKIGAVDDVWEEMQELATIDTNNYLHNLQVIGSYKFLVKALDTTGHESENAAAVAMNVQGPSQVVISQSVEGPNLVLTWTEASGQFAIAQYELRIGNTFASASPFTTVLGTSYTTKVDWTGPLRIWVVARDVAHNLGTENFIDITIQPPSVVQNLTAETIDNYIKMRWTVPSFHTLPIDYYDVMKGSQFATAQNIGRVGGTFALDFEILAGTYTYWIVPVDTAGNRGVEKGISATMTQPPDYVLEDDRMLDPNDGTGVNIIVEDDILRQTIEPSLQITVVPIEITDILANPDMGLQTTQKSLAQLNAETPPKNPAGYPSRAEVWRIQWPETNPSNGVYDFTGLDTAMRNARASNQLVNFRIITNDEANNPSGAFWLQGFAGVSGSGTPGWIYRALDDGGTTNQWAPDFSNSVVRTKFTDYITALADHTIDGMRFADHPNLGVIDTGVWGLYAENHFSGAMIAPGFTVQVPEPSQADQEWIIDTVATAFPNRLLVACVDSLTTLSYTVNSKGGGWRADGVGNPWHMNTLYPQRISQVPGMLTAPVVMLEPFSTINSWISNGWNVQTILNWCIAHGCTAFNTKNLFNPNSSVTTTWVDFIKRMGYRHVLTRLEHPQTVRANESFNLKTFWHNKGCAKNVNGHKVAVKFSRPGVGDFVHVTSEVANWVPGTAQQTHPVTPPSWLPDGDYALSIGEVEAVRSTPDVQLSIQGRDASGWYPLSTIEVVNNSATFSPMRYPGCKGYWTTQVASSLIKTKATQTVAVADEYVEQWRDQTAFQGHWEQTTATKVPQLKASTINSEPGLLFDGSNDFYLGNESLRRLCQNISKLYVFMVMRTLSLHATQSHVLAWNRAAGATNGIIVRMLDIGTPNATVNIGGRRLDGDSFASQTSVATHAANTTELRTMKFDFSNRSIGLWINGSNSSPIVEVASFFASAGNTSNTDFVSMALGSNSAGTGEFHNMYLCELAVFAVPNVTDPFIGASEIAAIEAGLVSPYGITLA